MPAKFTDTLAVRLNQDCRVPVTEACRGDVLRDSTVKIAPGGFHISVEAGGLVSLAAANGGSCPSVDVAMITAAKVFGARTIAVLLSGMGSDGVEGMAAILRSNGVAYIQDPRTCAPEGHVARTREDRRTPFHPHVGRIHS